MLIIQIQGYVVGILSFVLVILNEAFHFVKDAVLVVIVILLVHTYVVIFINVITGYISKKRK